MSPWSSSELDGRLAGVGLTDKPLRLRTVPCACGGEITADVGNPGPEVLRHNRTLHHRAWWVRVRPEWQGEP